jgi:acetyltransferase-like isoleucine patch superfamily enzyme
LVPGSRINILFDKPAVPIKIGSHTWIGSGCVIAPGVTIGEYSIVASNSYVDEDVPPFTIVGGNPAKVLRTVDPKELGL